MKKKLALLFLLCSTISYSQISESSGLYLAKEFSKDIALYKAKEFLMENVLEQKGGITKFEIDPLAAASSGEITSLVYRTPGLNKNGLILGFYGNRWNDSGVVYQSYGFKNLTESEAKAFFEFLDSINEEYKTYLGEDSGVNNIYFEYQDMIILMYQYDRSNRMRIFWNGFDSEWESTAYNRTLKRFNKKI